MGGFRNVTACKKCPDVVREEIRDYMIKKEEKDGRNLATGPDDYVSCFGDEYDNDMLGLRGVLVRNDQWQVETQAPLVQLFILLKAKTKGST